MARGADSLLGVDNSITGAKQRWPLAGGKHNSPGIDSAFFGAMTNPVVTSSLVTQTFLSG